VLHDVGKLAIPDSILLKNGKLTDDEWSVMRKHTTIGAELCRPLKTIGKTTEIVLSHHEKWNGSGYPHGHAGTDIPLLARVFQIVDVYDGLSTERPYKPAFPTEKVTDIMRSETAAGFWDPDLMEPFLKLLHEQPQVLKLPDSREIDRSEQMFDAIQKLGVSGWYTEEKS
jgi:putative two-component system response regulator